MESQQFQPEKHKLVVALNDSVIKFEYAQFDQRNSQVTFLDRSTGRVLNSNENNQPFHIEYEVTLIVGVLKLLKGPYLVLATRSEIVDSILGHQVYRICDAELIPLSTLDNLLDNETELKYIELVKNLICDGSFYFSYGYDLTNSQQRLAANAEIDTRFQWNIQLQESFNGLVGRDLVEDSKSLLRWCVPLIRGYFEKQLFCGESTQQHEVILISRRSWKREGRRYTMRGASKDGSVANYCEIEQIFLSDSHISSFVQTRGSIPLKWTQHANLAWDPPIRLKESVELQQQTCDNHLRTELRLYKTLSIVSLIKKTGSESKLGLNWDKALSAINEPKVNYHTFDLHKEVGHTKFSVLQKLWDQTDQELDLHGFFNMEIPSRKVLREQLGVMRTNCKDNLDRTNLVQHNLAQKVACEQLANGNGSKNALLEEDKTAVMRLIRIMWADCGDATSVQYAGTPAMRSDFAKTGRQTLMGHVNDGLNSLKRYYINNFEDGENQDALDIFLQKVPLCPQYVIDTNLQKPRGYNFIQRFLGNVFVVVYAFLKPAHVEGVRLIWGFFWMFSVFLTWTIFRLDPHLIVNRPVLRTNAKAIHLQNRLGQKIADLINILMKFCSILDEAEYNQKSCGN